MILERLCEPDKECFPKQTCPKSLDFGSSVLSTVVGFPRAHRYLFPKQGLRGSFGSELHVSNLCSFHGVYQTAAGGELCAETGGLSE